MVYVLDNSLSRTFYFFFCLNVKVFMDSFILDKLNRLITAVTDNVNVIQTAITNTINLQERVDNLYNTISSWQTSFDQLGLFAGDFINQGSLTIQLDTLRSSFNDVLSFLQTNVTNLWTNVENIWTIVNSLNVYGFLNIGTITPSSVTTVVVNEVNVELFSATFPLPILELTHGMELVVKVSTSNKTANPYFTPNNGVIPNYPIVLNGCSITDRNNVTSTGHENVGSTIVNVGRQIEVFHVPLLVADIGGYTGDSVTDLPVASPDLSSNNFQYIMHLSWDSTNNVWILLNPFLSNGVTPGTIIDWAGMSPPPGYLKCPTATTYVNVADYPNLYNAIGFTWDPSPPEGQFALPRYPIGFSSIAGQDGTVIGQVFTAHPTNTINPSGTDMSGDNNLTVTGVGVMKCVKY